jgi:hypothetical protein
MRRVWLTLLLAMGLGCCPSDREVAKIGHYGGMFIPSGEGWAVNCPPLFRVSFPDGALNDDAMKELSPILAKLYPKFLNFGNQPITDASVPLINQIHDAGAERITLGETKMTPEGRKRLNLGRPPSPP